MVSLDGFNLPVFIVGAAVGRGKGEHGYGFARRCFQSCRGFGEYQAPGTNARTLSIAAITSPAMAKSEAIAEIWSRSVLRP